MKEFAKMLCAVGIGTATVISVSGEELFSATKVQDFANGSGVSTSGNTLLVPRGKFLQSAKRFAYDPGKRYKLSCTVRLAKGESGRVFLGFVPLDAAGKKILSGEINAIPKSLTTLASAAGKGATELILTDGSRWNNTTPYGCIAFNADEKFSDLPNRTVVPMVKGSVEKRDGKWVAQLKKPLKNGYEAGTAVRQHVESDAFIYGVKKNLTGEKRQLTAVFSGHAANGLSSSRAWKGTAQVQMMIGFTTADAAGVMEISELKLEELL